MERIQKNLPKFSNIYKNQINAKKFVCIFFYYILSSCINLQYDYFLVKYLFCLIVLSINYICFTWRFRVLRLPHPYVTTNLSLVNHYLFWTISLKSKSLGFNINVKTEYTGYKQTKVILYGIARMKGVHV